MVNGYTWTMWIVVVPSEHFIIMYLVRGTRLPQIDSNEILLLREKETLCVFIFVFDRILGIFKFNHLHNTKPHSTQQIWMNSVLWCHHKWPINWRRKLTFTRLNRVMATCREKKANKNFNARINICDLCAHSYRTCGRVLVKGPTSSLVSIQCSTDRALVVVWIQNPSIFRPDD